MSAIERVSNYNPDLISWAITRAGYHLKDFLKENSKVSAWIESKTYPTVQQLERLSEKLHVPFGYFFLREAPQEKLPFPFFRSKTAASDKISLELYDTIQALKRRQNWLVDYLIEKRALELDFVGRYSGDDNPTVEKVVNDIRKRLDVKADWLLELKNVQEALKYNTDKIQDIGIIVSFNGVVGNNTQRPLPVEECRGFVLVDKYAPFMFINTNDSPAAQLFSMAHELAHIWRGESAGFENRYLLPSHHPLEVFCDKVAAEFLVPAVTFKKIWDEEKNVEKVSERFKISRIVIIRRALDLGLIMKDDFLDRYNRLISEFTESKRGKRQKGGDYYATTNKRLSRAFMRYVDSAVREDKLLYRDAYRLTGYNSKTYDEYIKRNLR